MGRGLGGVSGGRGETNVSCFKGDNVYGLMS